MLTTRSHSGELNLIQVESDNQPAVSHVCFVVGLLSFDLQHNKYKTRINNKSVEQANEPVAKNNQVIILRSFQA